MTVCGHRGLGVHAHCTCSPSELSAKGGNDSKLFLCVLPFPLQLDLNVCSPIPRGLHLLLERGGVGVRSTRHISCLDLPLHLLQRRCRGSGGCFSRDGAGLGNRLAPRGGLRRCSGSAAVRGSAGLGWWQIRRPW
jgi:hypothetical protein